MSTPCVGNPDPYDVLIESDKSTPGRRTALIEAVKLCTDCPIRFKCLSVDNRDEGWARMVVTGLAQVQQSA